MKHVYVNITAYVMAVIIIFTGIFSLPLSVSAQSQITASDDNGNNIIKVLDMALNKSGISASPTTIQDFLDYMYDTVTDGAQAWSDLASTAYDNVSDYVSACKDKVSDTASNIPVPAKSLINGYLDYMGNCFDTKANFDAGYAKGENFRNYLMSYVTDVDNKSLTGAIAKNNKYSINSGLVNLVRQNMDAYIEEYEGYYLVPTFTYKDISPSMFSTKDNYEMFLSLMKKIPDGRLLGFKFNSDRVYDYDYPNLNFVYTSSSYSSDEHFYVLLYNDDWVCISSLPYFSIYDDSLEDFPVANSSLYLSPPMAQFYTKLPVISTDNRVCLFTKDGFSVKIWKSLDTFKSYSVGKSNIYYSNTYSSFDNSVDNSITFSGDYYMNNDYSHTTIQNNIDNSQNITENTVNNIVNNYITNNNYGSDSSGSGGGGSGTGNWFLDLITGIPQLLAALVDGITALLESGGKLIEVITNLLTKLFVPSEGFVDPIKNKVEEKFSFVNDLDIGMSSVLDRFSSMGKTAPTITFPLSKTPLVEYGVEDITVSFDWFEPYRMGFQLLISAIMWAFFLFRQYFGIKNLIQGTDSFLFYG